MRIRMNVALSGRDFNYMSGEEYDVADELAEALCADDRASAVDEPKPKRNRKARNGRSTSERVEAQPEPDVEER